MKKLLLLAIVAIFLSGCGVTTNIENKSSSNSYPSPSNNSLLPVANTDKILDLSHKSLNKVDMLVFDKTNLEVLDVSNNNLTGALASQIGNLKKLKVLNASNNQMTGVPAEIGQLSNLEILDLSHNQLTGLPNELANLKKLKTLYLSGNSYSEQDLDIIRNSLPNVNYILE